MKLLKSNSENEVVKYPYSLGELRKEYPNVSFPSSPTAEDLAPFDCFIVKEKNPPINYDRITKSLVSSVHLFQGKWVQRWTITDATPEDVALRTEEQLRKLDYKGFWKTFTRSASYAALKAAAAVDLGANVLATELISVFADAKSKNLDAEAMALGVTAALSAVQGIDEELGHETETMLAAYDLDAFVQQQG
jgi:hypothetical protein